MSSYVERIRKSEKYHIFNDIAQMQAEKYSNNGIQKEKKTKTTETTLSNDFAMLFKRRRKKRERKPKIIISNFSVGALALAFNMTKSIQGIDAVAAVIFVANVCTIHSVSFHFFIYTSTINAYIIIEPCFFISNVCLQK